MKITITKSDIENGRRCDPDCCPIGRALSRAGVLHYGVVGSAVILAQGRHSARAFPLPEAVQEWILDYDGCRPVEPISFELQLPAEEKQKPRAAVRARQPALAAA